MLALATAIWAGSRPAEVAYYPSATARQWCASTPSWAQAEGKPLPKPGQPEEP